MEIFKLFRMMVCCQHAKKELLTAFGIHTINPHSINFYGLEKLKTDKSAKPYHMTDIAPTPKTNAEN